MGLVERKPDPNHARIFRAVLTDDGRRLAESCRADSLKIQRRTLETFDAEEREVFAGLLRRYIQALPSVD